MGRDYVLILVSLLLPLLFFNQASAFMDYDSDRPWRGDAVVAIDIGNTNSCVAGYGHGRVETMFQLCIPSWVAFTDNGTLLVGADARDHAAVDPGSAIFGFKRIIGIRSSWQVVQRLIKTVPYKLDEIVLIGGSTMIPKIQELIRDYFDGKEPNARLKPDVVTFGAALLGHRTTRD